MRRLSLALPIAYTLLLSGCAQTAWYRPGTSPAQSAMDSAQCQLIAEGANPDRGVDTVHTGRFVRDISANVALGLMHGIAQGVAFGRTHGLCMQAKGYLAGPPSSEPLQNVASGPVAPAAPSSPAQLASGIVSAPRAAMLSPLPQQASIVTPMPAPAVPSAPIPSLVYAPPIPGARPQLMTSACPPESHPELEPDFFGKPLLICHPYFQSVTVRVNGAL